MGRAIRPGSPTGTSKSGRMLIPVGTPTGTNGEGLSSRFVLRTGTNGEGLSSRFIIQTGTIVPSDFFHFFQKLLKFVKSIMFIL